MAVSTAAAAAGPPDPRPVTLSAPGDLVAAAPYLLHFHPTESVVLLAFAGAGYAGIARADLPEPAGAEAVGHALAQTMLDRGATSAAILGYGPPDRVDPVVPLIRDIAGRRGLPVHEMLRIHSGRWWSYDCTGPACCPPEGTPFDPATSEVSAQLTLRGLTAAPSRRDLEQRIAPVGGLARTSISQATIRAEARLAEWLCPVPEAGRPAEVLSQGRAAVRAAMDRYAAGGRLDDDELAWLAVLLGWLPVRDVAWQAITSERPHLALWTDVVRRTQPALVPAPACLLAFTAWRFGSGTLAGMALDRAQRADPDYSLAELLRQLLAQGPPGPEFAHWGTGEWEEQSERWARERARANQRAAASLRAQAGEPARAGRPRRGGSRR
jgi:hypothetical protein